MHKVMDWAGRGALGVAVAWVWQPVVGMAVVHHPHLLRR